MQIELYDLLARERVCVRACACATELERARERKKETEIDFLLFYSLLGTQGCEFTLPYTRWVSSKYQQNVY